MSTRVVNEFNGTITRIVIFGIYTWQLVNYIGKGSSGCNGKGDLPISQSNTGITSKPDWRLIIDVCAPKRMKHTDFNDLIVWKTIGWIAMQVCTDTHTPPPSMWWLWWSVNFLSRAFHLQVKAEVWFFLWPNTCKTSHWISHQSPAVLCLVLIS